MAVTDESKFAARVVGTFSPAIFAVVGFLLVSTFNRVEGSISTLSQAQTAIAKSVGELSVAIQWQQADNAEIKRRLEKLENRGKP